MRRRWRRHRVWRRNRRSLLRLRRHRCGRGCCRCLGARMGCRDASGTCMRRLCINRAPIAALVFPRAIIGADGSSGGGWAASRRRAIAVGTKAFHGVPTVGRLRPWHDAVDKTHSSL